MNILLWIALIGVFVFLLGFIYSKFSNNSAKQPAANTISPAISPPSPSENKAKLVESKHTGSDAAHPKTVNALKSPEISADRVERPALVKSAAIIEKHIPAAEPVGPAHSKPEHIRVVATASKPEKTSVSQSAPAVAVVVALEPERLTKPRNAKADDLSQITGIGKAIQSKLFSAGIFHYDQMADLSALQIDWLNNAIGFSGRYERENWGAQAKKLVIKSAASKQEPVKHSSKAVVKTATKAAAPKAKTTAKPKTKQAKKPSVAS